ncbi:hypothetical protein BKA65DRAFT_144057 [Rhexocercosporidium sp. MPI-PUGE-AT-0058]|nr:hypothetical protein BKA65DRAFT_144057 [Rhexocercosporidium sp. MPI-PUGE-AT-0058]
MGGFFLEAPDLSRPIPLDTEQIFYLVKNDYIDYPILSKEDIADKNKADGLARILAIFQALWFVTSTIARPIQDLSMTTLELTTISFVIVMFATSYCWLHKPSDISRPVILHCKVLMADIRRNEQLYDSEDYVSTPLDFVNHNHYAMGLIWEYYTGLLQAMSIPLFSRPIRSRPHNRNRSDKFLRTELDSEIFACFIILLFGSTFVCAWNFHFPTATERIIWRSASIYFMVFVVVGGGYTWIWHLKLLDKYETARLPPTQTTPDDPRKQEGFKHHAGLFLNKMRNFLLLSKQEAKKPDLPLRLLLPVSFLCAIYCIMRACIFIEDAISLRLLPSSAYATVNWSQYIPHV